MTQPTRHICTDPIDACSQEDCTQLRYAVNVFIETHGRRDKESIERNNFAWMDMLRLTGHGIPDESTPGGRLAIKLADANSSEEASEAIIEYQRCRESLS